MGSGGAKAFFFPYWAWICTFPLLEALQEFPKAKESPQPCPCLTDRFIAAEQGKSAGNRA